MALTLLFFPLAVGVVMGVDILKAKLEAFDGAFKRIASIMTRAGRRDMARLFILTIEMISASWKLLVGLIL